MAESLPYSKREQRGWYMYDWANSTFQSTVVTLFLGPYLTALAKAAAGTAIAVAVMTPAMARR